MRESSAFEWLVDGLRLRVIMFVSEYMNVNSKLWFLQIHTPTNGNPRLGKTETSFISCLVPIRMKDKHSYSMKVCMCVREVNITDLS